VRPYPDHYSAPFRLRDGREVLVRPIGPEDEPLLVALHARHSEHTIRMRFFGLVKALTPDSLIRLCRLDPERALALVAELREGDSRQLLGVSRFHLDPETGVAEFALVVGDPWQRLGLGRHLLERLIAIARERGVKRLVGEVLTENGPMLELTRRLGFTPAPTDDDRVVGLSLELQ
jgi:acetyltransferase